MTGLLFRAIVFPLFVTYVLFLFLWAPSTSGHESIGDFCKTLSDDPKAVSPLLLLSMPAVLFSMFGLIPQSAFPLLRGQRSIRPLPSPASLLESLILRVRPPKVKKTTPDVPRTPLLQPLFLLLQAVYVYIFSARHYEGRLDDHFWMEAGNAPAILSLYNLAFFLIPVSALSPIMASLSIPHESAISLHRLCGNTVPVLVVLHGLVHFFRWVAASSDPGVSSPNMFAWLMFPPSDCSKFTCDDCSCYDLNRNALGMWAAVSFAAISVLSTHRIRRHSYSLFFASHVILGPIAIVLSVLHWNRVILYVLPSLLIFSYSKTIVLIQSLQSVCVNNTPISDSKYHIIDLKCPAMPVGTFVRIAEPMPSGIIAKLRWFITPSHPFTVFGSKIVYVASGPFTKRLVNLQCLSVTGPYSGLNPPPSPSDYCVAGGVGVTPFIGRRGTLIWCTRDNGLVTYLGPSLHAFTDVRVYHTDGGDEGEGESLIGSSSSLDIMTGGSQWEPSPLTLPRNAVSKMYSLLCWILLLVVGMVLAFNNYEVEHHTIKPRWSALILVEVWSFAFAIFAYFCFKLIPTSQVGAEIELDNLGSQPETNNITHYNGRPSGFDFPKQSRVFICGPAGLRDAVKAEKSGCLEEVFEW